MPDEQNPPRLAPQPSARMKSEAEMSVGKGYRLTRGRLAAERDRADAGDGRQGPDEGGYG